jgi:hypothetical protein
MPIGFDGKLSDVTVSAKGYIEMTGYTASMENVL